MNTESKAIQALNLLKGIVEDAQIKLVEHQLANQSIDVIYNALRELHNLKNNSNQKKESGSIFTNMKEEELEIVFSSGKHKIPHSGYPRCCLIKSVSQSIPPSNDWSNITWDSIDYDNNDMHSIVINHERLTIKRKGIYVFGYKIRIQTNDKISSCTRLVKKGTEIIPRSGKTVIGSKDSSVIIIESKTPMIELDVDDYIVLQGNHDDKSLKNIFPNDSYLSCEKRY
ncbi:hypothetical protein KAR91_04090 [Candidatus Pacearchaeota archaeon]|nr:hypothetical protein [Candidatus Pacearchaeota archaeon]